LEALPDTTLQLTTGKRVIATESAEDVVQRIVEFRRDIFYKYPAERFLDRTVEKLDPKHPTVTER